MVFIKSIESLMFPERPSHTHFQHPLTTSKRNGVYSSSVLTLRQGVCVHLQQ